jgi:hypothetical protein
MLKILRDQREGAGSAEFTAVSFLTLSLGGRNFQVQNLDTSSTSARELRMKPKEFMASITGTSCLLAALLNIPDISTHAEKIEKMVNLLVDAFDGGSLLEDGNLSLNHIGMLLVGVLVAFHYRWDHGAIDDLDNETARDKVPTVLFQALKYICSKQDEDGSWESSSVEPTAYAIITIAHLVRLPWHPSVMAHAKTALQEGRQYLQQNSDTWNDPSFFRAEKVTFSSAILREAYCLAALKSPTESYDFSLRTQETFSDATRFRV